MSVITENHKSFFSVIEKWTKTFGNESAFDFLDLETEVSFKGKEYTLNFGYGDEQVCADQEACYYRNCYFKIVGLFDLAISIGLNAIEDETNDEITITGARDDYFSGNLSRKRTISENDISGLILSVLDADEDDILISEEYIFEDGIAKPIETEYYL